MNILVISVLKVIFFSFVSSDSCLPPRLCVYDGSAYQKYYPNFTFSLSDVPKRCGGIIYSSYSFDGENGPFYEGEDAIMKSISEAKIPVLTYIGYMNDEYWDDLFCDQATYDKLVVPLIKNIKEIGISGIIFIINDLFAGDYHNKMSNLVNKMKTELPTLKFGLYLSMYDIYANLSDTTHFNFTVANDVLDIYLIETYTPYTLTCTSELAASGTLITSPDSSIMTLDTNLKVVLQTSIDKSKIYAVTHVCPTKGVTMVTYSEYCRAGIESCEWCADNTQKLHDIGEFAKKNFHGIAVAWPPYDDSELACGCQPYPAVNAMLDGYDGIASTPCPKIDKK